MTKMESLIASYGGTSHDSDSELDCSTTITVTGNLNPDDHPETKNLPLPPLPLSFLNPSNSLGKSQKSCANLSIRFCAY